MKVVILGPAVNNEISGGVAIFDEGLYKGFCDNGDEAYLISSNKSSLIKNLLVGKREIKPSKIIFHFRKIGKMIRDISPDLVISSLHYSLGIKTYKRMFNNCRYIQVLHGFPCAINGRLKAWLINKTAKFSRKHFDYVVTVSFLSYAVNKKIDLIECDKVIYNGCNFKPQLSDDRPIDFIYIGRLFRDKEVKMIADAFVQVKRENPKIKLVIAGYGELENVFKSKEYVESGIEFVGKLNQFEVCEMLGKSKFFISMNPLEPFGIVFSEALLSGCNIITQSSSGCVPIYIKKDYFHIADCLNYSELASRLLTIINHFHRITNDELKEIGEFSSFKRVAMEYKELAFNPNENDE